MCCPIMFDYSQMPASSEEAGFCAVNHFQALEPSAPPALLPFWNVTIWTQKAVCADLNLSLAPKGKPFLLVDFNGW